MNPTVEKLLNGREGNNLLPFFWQHGEDEATLRHYMGVVQGAGCGAVCVESRPHPDFCGPGWWRDMDIILDEARSRGMRVWFLDDDHFPTGHAAGAVETADAGLCRQSVIGRAFEVEGAGVSLTRAQLIELPEAPKSPMQEAIESMNPPQHRHFDDDRLLGAAALRLDKPGEAVDLTPLLTEAGLEWEKPAGEWRVYSLLLSRNYGPHRGHMNMMQRESVKLLLDNVYEPHYARYKDDFGATIAGFFSDEPELGNGALYVQGNTLGTPQDLPWSQSLEETLLPALGENWATLLPLLWENGGDAKQTAFARTTYMSCVTKLVEENFSRQIGDWCRARGVEYIGHVVEDDNQHARTASSLGHYFRGLAGQDMAGIDVIGPQVLPQGEDEPSTGMFGRTRDGEFYHYLLAKLGDSHAAIDPLKKGRVMCELFGAYGWMCGVQLQKYIADHLLVRGVNHFTPHAFNPGPYPDPDCPPHFYAHGHNPQYRHFGALLRYTNRLAQLLSDGRHIAPVAVLYHAEAEWAGGEFMLDQKPARVLTDSQIDFDIIPSDVFSEADTYRTSLDKGLVVNTQEYRAFVLPMATFITAAAAKAAAALHRQGFPVLFLEALPTGVCDGDDALLEALQTCEVVPLAGLVAALEARGLREISLSPASGRLRCRWYKNPEDFFLFVNEGTAEYSGSITLPVAGPCYIYNAWENRLEAATATPAGGKTALAVRIPAGHSLAVQFGPHGDAPLYTPPQPEQALPLGEWTRCTCTALEYPAFGRAVPVTLPDALAAEQPAFSGLVRYDTLFTWNGAGAPVLEISDAAEGVEVFVNGHSAGLQVAPPYRFDLAGLAKPGDNSLAIEVATTLERDRYANATGGWGPAAEPTCGSGITGSVTLRV